jgi:hypothetical protein
MPLIDWKDPSEWMESMRGPRWTARIHAENRAYQKALSSCATDQELHAATTAFEDSYLTSEMSSMWLVERGSTKIQVFSENGGEFRWSSDGESILAADLDVAQGGIVIYTTDVGKAKYKARARRNGKPLWTHDGTTHGLGPDIAILGRRVYLLEATGHLQYDSLVSLDIFTGKDRRVHFRETKPFYALSLVRGENGCLFLVSENAAIQDLYHVDKNVRRLSEEYTSFYPVGFAPNSREPCYFAFKNGWIPFGSSLKRYKLPKAHGIDAMILRHGLFIHRSHGERYIDLCGKRDTKRLAKFIGGVSINPWNAWHGVKGPLELHFTIPGRSTIRGFFDDTLHIEAPTTIYADMILTGMTQSRDGTHVRWCIVSNENRPPKGVIIVGYGAYNIPTSFDTTRWKPFLERGFAVGFALVRGGGDHDDKWAEAARVHNKIRSVEDLEACVRAIRAMLNLNARQTCIFGRSAGGYLVGSAATRNPDGKLFGSIYAEVPYVDVLKTASNARLPLTKYEYLEFGDPQHVIIDFETLLRIGPVSGLDEKGAPGLYVVCRTGLNDRQVYAYESVKWMDALRGKNRNSGKLLEVAEEDGHFTRGNTLHTERARDFLLLSKRILA